jgi:4'-phosphopantetheinyl transferase
MRLKDNRIISLGYKPTTTYTRLPNPLKLPIFVNEKWTRQIEVVNLNKLKIADKYMRWIHFSVETDKDIQLEKALTIISDEEKARAGKFRFDRDRDRFVRGRAYLRTTLADCLDITPETVDLKRHEHGKLYLEDDPVYFNLTHSAGSGVIVVSEEHLVGVDLEFVNRKVKALEVARTVLVDRELDYLEATRAADRERMFLYFWTAKEAYLKLLGTGLSLEPNKVSLQLGSRFPVGCESKGYSEGKLTYLDLNDESAICCLCRPR